MSVNDSETVASAVKVLIVEDDFLVRMTLAETMCDAGFDVVEVESGEAALGALRDNPDIRLLMTDLSLAGGMDGSALARNSRELRPKLPILFMTGRPDLVTTELQGNDLIVGKPYSPADICLAARSLVAEP